MMPVAPNRGGRRWWGGGLVGVGERRWWFVGRPVGVFVQRSVMVVVCYECVSKGVLRLVIRRSELLDLCHHLLGVLYDAEMKW
ncbi:hypothetical protein HanRHA438_Chr08g0371041 [Helianthus annuus]|uniref:Uncharacterized protein n=1 Tax=Helianthus annuus TaxID=4232 RepID=A0A9K3IHS9_HELAN|nr:hypothetical protein HanXRQr2_Chr08g0358971 [Helianthus annuus]KAJ0540279.1 hypothetical protein HanHA300_Chr08g0296431 [Helianthus annuus]KAJ0548779.1 hypothetical protein HanIR_Chr08g0387621 [Helianthus annuus]KAJ0555023.1 hypothetical protein HanHA89_Chr08g0314941 [Helianthus annuus]KAJ0720591.1 hypothetical protein HanLR1_Chr08g0295301 [Helianthus annuus]